MLKPTDFLQRIAAELKCISQEVCLTLESVSDLLDANCEDFQRVSVTNDQQSNIFAVSVPQELSNRGSAFAKSDRYWIPWTKYMGAWVTADGREVAIVLSEQADSSDLEAPLTTGLVSVITGACLNLQGKVAIHANAIAIDEIAVAFVGYSGMGKSTLSAYCASQGAELITDDVLMVNDQGLVHPGNPRLKLYPHTGESLGLDSSEETDYKIYYHPSQLGSVLSQKPVPLGALYLLAKSEDETGAVYTETLSPPQAVFELLTHSYYASNLIPENPDLLDAHVRLVTQVPVKRLFYPRNFVDLPKVYDFLVSEINF